MIGDSIAVGVGHARPECETVARVGITSERYIAELLPLAETSADTTVISLGVNDGDGQDTLGNLRAVRGRVHSRVVYWLLPGIKPQVRDIIRTVAAENGDRLIDTMPEASLSRDHLHPSGSGYAEIAAETDGGEAPPVEVAEAPAHMSLPGEGGYHVTYSALPARRTRRERLVALEPPFRRHGGRALTHAQMQAEVRAELRAELRAGPRLQPARPGHHGRHELAAEHLSRPEPHAAHARATAHAAARPTQHARTAQICLAGCRHQARG